MAPAQARAQAHATACAGVCERLNLDAFAVRIMAVDFQNQLSSGFEVVDDTNMVFNDAATGMHAFIQCGLARRPPPAQWV